MKITNQMIQKMEKVIDRVGSQAEFARQCGIERQSVSKYLSGVTRRIEDETWKKMAPVFQRHLPVGEFEWAKSFYDFDFREADRDAAVVDAIIARGDFKEGRIADVQSSNVAPYRGVFHTVPVISIAQAAGFDPTVEPVDCYAFNCSDLTEAFATEAKPGYFALRIEGDSMLPDYPSGSIILVAGGEFPQKGDEVVAKIRSTGQVVFKGYNRHENIITLSSMNPAPDAMNFEWNCKEQPGFIEWMYPVLETKINNRKRRWDRVKNGMGVAEDGAEYKA